MKRNRYGINLDEGIPLESKWEFDNLYVPFSSVLSDSLSDWICQGKAPIMIGGQIGSGKSSFIKKAFIDSVIQPDMTLHFDVAGLNLSTGDFLRIVLTGLCEFALDNSIDLVEFSLPHDVVFIDKTDWIGLHRALSADDNSLVGYKSKKEISEQLASHPDYFTETLIKVGQTIQRHLGRSLLVFASGLDKFDSDSAAWFAMEDVFSILNSFKTLFEVNLVHLFNTPQKLNPIDRLVIHTMSDEDISEVIHRRLGVYAQNNEEIIKLITDWSGGNPRQAIRILDHFNSISKGSQFDRFQNSLFSTIRDYFSFSPRPDENLMKFVLKNKIIKATEFTLPGDRDTARRALYGNWIFINGENQDGTWKTSVNPLVKQHFLEEKIVTEEPEMELLRSYAEQFGMSSEGLSPRMTDMDGEMASSDNIAKLLLESIDSPIEINLTEVLDMVAAALLSKDRSDRIIVAYKDEAILAAVRAYLIAKANSYEFQAHVHRVISGGEDHDPLEKFLEFIDEKTDIYSIQFQGSWTPKQLLKLDNQRDKLTQIQMIWWIEYERLKIYLQHWTQLRQLFEVYILDDDLLESLSIEEIESDIAFVSDLDDEENNSGSEMISQLKIVLDYLKSARNGSHE